MTRLPSKLATYDDPETGWYAVGVTNDGEYVVYADTHSAIYRWSPTNGDPNTGTQLQLEPTNHIESWLAGHIDEYLVLHPRYRWIAAAPVETMPIETTVEEGSETEIVARTPRGSTLAVPKTVCDSTTDEDLLDRAQACFIALLEVRPTSARTLTDVDCTLTIVVGELRELTLTQREQLCHRLMRACLECYYREFTDEDVSFDSSMTGRS